MVVPTRVVAASVDARGLHRHVRARILQEPRQHAKDLGRGGLKRLDVLRTRRPSCTRTQATSVSWVSQRDM